MEPFVEQQSFYAHRFLKDAQTQPHNRKQPSKIKPPNQAGGHDRESLSHHRFKDTPSHTHGALKSNWGLNRDIFLN